MDKVTILHHLLKNKGRVRETAAEDLAHKEGRADLLDPTDLLLLNSQENNDPRAEMVEDRHKHLLQTSRDPAHALDNGHHLHSQATSDRAADKEVAAAEEDLLHHSRTNDRVQEEVTEVL